MMKEVQIKITGRQKLGEEKDETIVCAEGTYELNKEVHRVEYDEKQEDGAIIHNVIRASERGVKIEKRGAVVTDMFFVPGKKKEVKYQTPYGMFIMENDCSKIDIACEGERLLIKTEYTLCSNGELVSECETEIVITEKKKNREN